MTNASFRQASLFVLVVLAACGGDDTVTAETTPANAGVAPSSGGESSGAGEVMPSHGASLWGVYVVVAAPGAPELEVAAAPLRERGISVSVGEIGCDAGATEALSAASDVHGVSVMFDTREAADRFAQTLSSPPAGIAHVTVGCAD